MDTFNLHWSVKTPAQWMSLSSSVSLVSSSSNLPLHSSFHPHQDFSSYCKKKCKRRLLSLEYYVQVTGWEYHSVANTGRFSSKWKVTQRTEPRAMKNHFSSGSLSPNEGNDTCAQMNFRTDLEHPPFSSFLNGTVYKIYPMLTSPLLLGVWGADNSSPLFSWLRKPV